MQRLAQAWLVLKLTNSPFALGTVTTLQFLPIMLFSLYGGVIADRFPKRRLLLLTQSVATVQAIALATLTSFGIIHLWHIYVLATILGLANAFDQPASRSFSIELVGHDEVANAVALDSILFNGSRVVGPSLAGISIATIGVGGCFWLNAVSFLAVIGSLLAMKRELFYAQPKRQRGSTRQLLAGGLAYATRTPEVFVLLLILLFLGTFCYNFGTFLPLLSRFTLHTNSLGYGFLFSALGIGSVCGAVSIAYARVHSLGLVFLSSACFVVLLGLLGLSHVLLVSLALLLFIGFFSLAYSASTQTRLQLIVPNELRGRVMSLYTLLFQGSTPIGSLVIGGIAQRWSVEAAMETATILAGAGVVFASLYQRRRSRMVAVLPSTVLASTNSSGREAD